MTDIRKKLQTVTLGCSKNKVDTEHILSQVDDLYEIVPEGEDIPVDVLLINTCGFIESAKAEAIENILECAAYKNEGNLKALVVHSSDNLTESVLIYVIKPTVSSPIFIPSYIF